MRVYGLKTCETCRKALSALSAAGLAPEFVDIRSDASVPGRLPGWAKAAGAERLVNRASMTWRKLSDADKARASGEAGIIAVLSEHPTLIKRPVIEHAGKVHVGWTKDVQAALGLAG
jgi:arsenate reductase (glutaredoxin)